MGRCEIAVLVEHVGFQLRAPRRFFGPSVPLRIALTDVANDEPSERWTGGAIAPLREVWPDVEFRFDQQRTGGRGYYRTVCFKLHAQVAGEWVDLGDGGDVAWTARLLSDAKERLFISALSSERIAAIRSGQNATPRS